ncbi:hypothetical protein EW026_g3441 [Hermanssonia centrifuga]|uniref:DUF6534 domain-containing protein n=1 Tax=Hermanssonia centrifuga TaxID=98765 RepID=A0A4S4KKP2_9APHY|nr:hypothetical protein EW026_g3441 [Hermanssonia centrifuga]
MSVDIGAVTKDNTYGAAFVGFACSCVVFGIVCTQMWTYFQRYPLDRPFYKVLVAVLWLLEVVDQTFIGHATYFYAITNWGNPLILLAPPVSGRSSDARSSSGSNRQSMFCNAISNGNKYVTTVIVILVIAQLGIACVYTEQALRLESLLFIVNLKVVGSSSLIVGLCTDIITSGSLCYFLHNLRTGYSKDDSLVNRLTLYAVNTGVLTSAVSLATVILYNLMPDNFIFMACYFVLSKLYVNSFLATLNTRRVLRGRGTDAETNTMPTFLMVGKLTKHNPNQFADHVYPPSSAPGSKLDINHSQQYTSATALEVGVDREVTVTTDSFDTHYYDSNIKKPNLA